VSIYTGYIGSASFLSTVLKVVDRLRAINPNLVYGKGFLLFNFC
jgi:pyridoxine kinase